MTVLGVDFKTDAIDLAFLNDDDDQALRLRVELAGASSFERARSTRRYFPSRRYLEDDLGVVLAGVEKPLSRSFKSTSALMRLQGAIAVLLPAGLPVLELRPSDWRHELGLPGGGPKSGKPHVRRRVLELNPDAATWGQDSIDAYAIAYAARATDQRTGRFT